MKVKHKSGLLITDRADHFKSYDGDARYVVWTSKNGLNHKPLLWASYLPTLVKYLDITYTKNTYRKGKR